MNVGVRCVKAYLDFDMIPPKTAMIEAKATIFVFHNEISIRSASIDAFKD